MKLMIRAGDADEPGIDGGIGLGIDAAASR
jgi:hypothetical protein